MKLRNHAKQLIKCEQKVRILSDWSKQCKFSFIRVYSRIKLYEADGLWCRNIQSLGHCYRSGRC